MRKLAAASLCLGLSMILTGHGAALPGAQDKEDSEFEGKNAAYWIKQLSSNDAAQRLKAAQALIRIRPKATQAVPILVKTLKDENKEVRVEAAYALGVLGSNPTVCVPALLPLLEGSEEECEAAVMALSRFGLQDKAVLPALTTALKHRSVKVRRAAADGLAQVGPAGNRVGSTQRPVRVPAALRRRSTTRSRNGVSDFPGSAAGSDSFSARSLSPTSRNDFWQKRNDSVENEIVVVG